MIGQLISIRDLKEWEKCGRGHSLQFYALDEEVQSWLSTALPERYAPYQLLGVDTIGDDQFGYRRQPHVCEVSGFLEDRQFAPEGSASRRTMYWIWSHPLTPELWAKAEELAAAGQGMRVDALAGLNRLVLLQDGRMRPDLREYEQRLRRLPSVIGHISQVRNPQTGEVRRYQGYEVVYKALHRAISKNLLYASIDWDADRHESEGRLVRWTEAAKISHESGMRYWSRPGTRLRK